MDINVHLKGLIKMSAFTNAINDINRKKAGMLVLCMSASAMLEGEAKANARWTDRTSHARQSLNAKTLSGGNNFIIRLSHGAEYGGILEEGSKPHVITPKSAQALYWRGASHPVKSVQHPGTKATPIIKPTIDKNIGKIGNMIFRYWSD
ncbi:TPA: hypothetical protein ACXDT2_001183 [Clostridioides difficile]|uniref:HK97 gp10 family phage protein n=3 Tax=root TaxID=1 RepID=A0A3G1E371_9CAUD|nr:hypothetical protein [Clostridioides difficile]YP_009830806.1 hypothetical protein HWA97_gp10 [Clostridium phage CDKM9]ANT45078.1 hypothetical protein CDHM9_10 [Clostridium phage CDKM9]OMK66861.1 hypothetical protein BER32_003873 [Clostridioides difficile]CCL36138.1 conserved exported hypothetical protein [Clostridioides difficile T23]CCL55348.1 conserved exported hypothetical protein [Clostridioides difficile E14]SJN85593.1 Uncharacterised protein [Clostridioides difficile]